MGEDREQSEVSDFGEILNGTPDDSPLLVGGHAVNVWALLYHRHIDAELKCQRLLPLTSKDLDLYGDGELLESLRMRFGGAAVFGAPRGPVVGQLTVDLNGKTRTIEVLRNVLGLTTKHLQLGWLPIVLKGYRIRVPTPANLLRAKLANVARLDQEDRNDVRHVRILVLVIREHLNAALAGVRDGVIGARPCINALEEIRSILSSDDAARCVRLHGVSFDAIWPQELLRASSDEKIRNFVRHRLPDAGP